MSTTQTLLDTLINDHNNRLLRIEGKIKRLHELEQELLAQLEAAKRILDGQFDHLAATITEVFADSELLEREEARAAGGAPRLEPPPTHIAITNGASDDRQ